jgi:TonB family protein
VVTPAPGYPHLAFTGGVVLVEARVNAKGLVVEAQVSRSAPPFDAVAVEATRRWRFRPAYRRGAAVDAVVYIIFGFPTPAG